VFDIDGLLYVPSIRMIDWSKIKFKPMTHLPYKSIKEYFEFPDKLMRDEYQKTKKDVWLAGFYSKNKD
jgi:hypothetical protein